MATEDFTPPPGTGFQPAPMNRPPAQPLGVGVQPGTPNIIRAFQVIIAGGAGSGLFVYSPTVGLGNLIFSIAAQAGTDPYGNAYLGNGLAVYGSGFTEFLGLASGAIPELQFRTGLANESFPGNIAGGVLGAGAAATMQLLSSGPKGAAVGGRQWAQVYLISSSQDLSAIAQGQLRYIDDAGTVTQPLVWDANSIGISNRAVVPNAVLTSAQLYGSSGLSSNLKYKAFDGNAYNTGRLSIQTIGSQTISSTTPVTIAAGGNSFSAPVAIGGYHFRAHMMYVDNGAGVANTPAFRVNSPAFTNGSCQLVGAANGPLLSVRFDNASTFGTPLLAPTVTPASNVRHDAVIEGEAEFTASGTINVQAALNAAGAAQYVIASGSTFELFPIA